MNYYIYQITNLVNGKIYIGKRVSKLLPFDDKYFGSGKLIKMAIKKYGLENFQKDILFLFNNKVELETKELEIVNETFVKRPDTYNMHIGGKGGFEHINNDPIKKQERKFASIEANKRLGIGGTKHWTKKGREKVIAQCKLNQKKAVEASRLVAILPEERKIRSERLSTVMRSSLNVARGTHFYVNPETKEFVRYKEGRQPADWITTKEYKEQLMKVPERWFNDGTRNYLISPENIKVKELFLKRGRIKAQKSKD